MVMAIMLVGLVAMMLAALAVTSHTDAQRTMSATADAQLRQLLVAGAHMAPASFQTDLQNIQLPLPRMLRDDGATLTLSVHRISATMADARLQAKFHGRQMMQQARYENRDGQWRLISARLSDF